MSPFYSIRCFFHFRFKSVVTVDQSVNTPPGATEYAVLLKKNILLENGSSYCT